MDEDEVQVVVLYTFKSLVSDANQSWKLYEVEGAFRLGTVLVVLSVGRKEPHRRHETFFKSNKCVDCLERNESNLLHSYSISLFVNIGQERGYLIKSLFLGLHKAVSGSLAMNTFNRFKIAEK